MPIKQGINFRATSGYVTDGADHTYEILASTTANYPTTTPQGFNVGWESSGFGSGSQTRDRSTSVDTRLAGCVFNTSGTDVLTYRFDLTAAGAHDIRVAAGDNAYARTGLKVEVFDTTTSLGVLVNTGTTAGGRFRDAADAEYTAANWPGSNALVSKTFGTTICRFKIGNGSNQTFIAHLYVEGASGGGGVALSASGGGVATGIASMTISVPMSASGSAVATGAATMQTLVPMSASGGATATGLAAMATIAPMAASGSAVATASATMQTVIQLSASGSASATGLALMSVAGGAIALSASGLGVATGSATMQIAVPMSASGYASATGLASLQTIAPMAAVGYAVATGSALMSVAGVGPVALSASGYGVLTGLATMGIKVPLAASGYASATGLAIMSDGSALERAPAGSGSVLRDVTSGARNRAYGTRSREYTTRH